MEAEARFHGLSKPRRPAAILHIRIRRTLLLIIGVVLVAGIFLATRRQRAPAAKYKAKGALCSHTEGVFLAALEEALPRSQRVFVQVRLIDVIEPDRADTAARNRVISKQLDFVICDRRTLWLKPCPQRACRCTFFKAAARYSPAAIRQQLFQNGPREEPKIDPEALTATDEWPRPS